MVPRPKYAYVFYVFQFPFPFSCFEKAAVICGCIGIVAEVSYEALRKRYDQGWVCEIINDLDALIERVRAAKQNQEVCKTPPSFEL